MNLILKAMTYNTNQVRDIDLLDVLFINLLSFQVITYALDVQIHQIS